MQPEPNEITQKILLTQNTQDSHHPSHHGIDHYDEQPSSRPRTGEGSPDPRRSASDIESSASSDRGSDDASGSLLRRLSPPSSPRTRSPVDRIAKYEKALTYVLKKRTEVPGFTVVQREKKASSSQTAITDFPNGQSQKAI